MKNSALKEAAIELVEYLRGVANAKNLRRITKDRDYLVIESRFDKGRTIELQILDCEDDEVEVAAFSDGASGSIGVNVIYFCEGMRLVGEPRLFIDGVPGEVIATK